MNGALLHQVGRGLLTASWAAVVAAPFAAHAAIATGRFTTVAAGLAVVQVSVLTIALARQSAGPRRVLLAAGGAILVTLTALRLMAPAELGQGGLLASSGVAHAAIYTSLLLLFARSLRPGGTPLVTGLATRVRGGLTPDMLAYTRGVTQAWVWFFAAQLAASALLLAVAPHRVWSLFVNVLDGPLVIVMFTAEYAVRRWRFRNYRHISPIETMRSFARSRDG